MPVYLQSLPMRSISINDCNPKGPDLVKALVECPVCPCKTIKAPFASEIRTQLSAPSLQHTPN